MIEDKNKSYEVWQGAESLRKNKKVVESTIVKKNIQQVTDYSRGGIHDM